MTGKSVCAAEREDGEGAGRFAGFRDEALENFMDSAIASAGEDDVCTVEESISRLNGRGAGSGSGCEFDAVAKSGKSLGNLAKRGFTKMPLAARGRVIDEDTAHGIILRRGFRKDAHCCGRLVFQSAFSVSWAQRA